MRIGNGRSIPSVPFSDACWAGAFSALLHLALLWLVLSQTSGSGATAGPQANGGAGLSVSFVPEFRQKIDLVSRTDDATTTATAAKQAAAAAHDDQPRPSPLPDPARESTTDANPNRTEAKESGAAASTHNPASHAGSASATSGTDGGQGDFGLREAYLAALRATILAKWNKPDADLDGCTIALQQEAGGKVTAARLGGCALPETDRNELEAAALMAQPLPYAGYEAVFSETVNLDLEKR